MCTFLEYFSVTAGITTEQMRNKFDYQEKGPLAHWKKYYKTAKFNKSVNINWVECDPATN